MKRIVPMLLLPLVLAACQAEAPAPEQPASAPAAPPAPDPSSPEGKIASAMSAAPTAIGSAATIMDMGADMSMTELRAGTNGWTCLPDMPNTPGPDPMCLDAQGVTWVQAWMSKATPKLTADGLAYMLQGGSDPSNDDPFAAAPATGEGWVNTPPHVMILVVNPKSLDTMSNDPNVGGPFVMFRGTPYAHIMMPVADPR
jgi:hypothetical protein